MKHFTQTCFLLITCIVISNISFANDGRHAPSLFTTARFMASVKRIDSINAVNATAKVCACQILNLRSNNHQVKNAVVFAEKTNKEGNDDLVKAKMRLEKEKRLMRILFFPKIEVLASTSSATDCNTLFIQLKKKQDDLLLYEVLNADIIVK
ncbi:hypothetical protein [Niastella sp. OAS944]|uniref:hypothetical protein n=1 Tax=Niastella sp. OAS944 TaxID=2664089 RepID=UPI0034880946|nr:hypothetical protein [Chitinophagaceae bacterium OAS944]